MRILMTADTVGGVWTYAMELVRSLAAHDVFVDLATMGAPLSDEQAREASAISNLAIHQSRFKLEWMDSPWPDVERSGRWLLELEETIRPDVVHLNGYAHGALKWNAPVLVVGHSCVLSWWQAVKGEAAPIEWNRYRDEARRGLHAADFVIAPTRAMLDELERFYGALPSTRVIFNSREAAKFAPATKEPFILAAGRVWDEAKNIGALEVIAPSLSWPVQVAGDEQHPQGGQAHHRNLTMLGRLTECKLAARMASASIYALPARYEPFGLSVLEAGLSGCALVLGDIPTLREVWEDAAIFVAPDDHHALKDAIAALISDDSKRSSLSRRAREHALLYNTSSMARRYFEVYETLCRVKMKQITEDKFVASAT